MVQVTLTTKQLALFVCVFLLVETHTMWSPYVFQSTTRPFSPPDKPLILSGGSLENSNQAPIQDANQPGNDPGHYEDFMQRQQQRLDRSHAPKKLSRVHRVKTVRPTRVIEFLSCGGLSNQRISIMMGMTIAYLMDRIVVLPKVQEDFIQETPMVPFDHIFDSEYFTKKVSPYLKVWPELPGYMNGLPAFDLVTNLKMLSNQSIQYTKRQIQLYPRVRMDCPFFGINLNQNEIIANFSWIVDDALKFNDDITSDAEKIIERIGNPDFVLLHVRIEQDWKDHCKVWIGDNCYTDPEGIKQFMMKKNISSELPIYVAGVSLTNEELAPLNEVYQFTSKEMLIPDELAKYEGKRDLLAAIDYAVAERAKIFIGNSVSTFSALQLIKRIDNGKPSFHYNEGIIPLMEFIPSVKKLSFRYQGSFTWVFAMNNRSSAYDEMAKVAVASAYMRTSLKMVCLYDGAPNNMTHWMDDMGVKVIFHKLSWFDALKHESIEYNQNDQSSTNYASPEALAATFVRSDIPIIPELKDEDYVLYSDIDIIFMQDIKPSDIKVWPRYFACGPEDKPEIKFPCNMGVMLMNLVSLRNTHAAFLKYVLGSKNMRFVDGPADQGAYNGFYKGRIDQLPIFYNWKPYWRRSQAARLLHFHGPKPADYTAWLQEQKVINPLFQYLLTLCNRGACKEHMDSFIEVQNALGSGNIKQYAYRPPPKTEEEQDENHN